MRNNNWKTYNEGELVTKSSRPRLPGIIKNTKKSRFAGTIVAPQFWAVIEIGCGRVVGRCMPAAAAEGFARHWSKSHGETCTVPDPVTLVSDDLICEQWK